MQIQNQMKVLLNNQSEAITHLQTKKVGALFEEPGTGKTRTAVELIKQVDPNYVLWFAPFKSVNPKIPGTGIKDEVLKWHNFDKIEFIGLQSLGMSDRIYLEIRNKLESANNPFIVVDESLLIKNSCAKRTQRLFDLSQFAEYKLILNGTPFSKDLTDLWSQMQFLSPKILNMDFAQFENTFCEKITIKKNGRITNEFIIGYENIDYLYHLIRPFIYEADLVLDVKVQDIYINYSISEEGKKEYKRVKEYFLCENSLEEYNNNIFLMMVQKLQHIYCCEQSKLDVVKEIIKRHGIENVAVYTKFVASREFLEKNIKNISVFSLQSDSLSLNLQTKYNVTIEYDKTWDWANVDQYKRRVFRTGQDRECYHYYLDGNIPLDYLIKENNKKKLDALSYFKRISKQELKEIL